MRRKRNHEDWKEDVDRVDAICKGELDDVPDEIRRRSKPKRPAEELKPSNKRWIPFPEPSSGSSSNFINCILLVAILGEGERGELG